ncbi:MAG: glycosyltransferase family 4 protein [Magnetococcales bacterium]|nr:glycosyltransferase family 4 protein [Magnetococcales bacterium]
MTDLHQLHLVLCFTDGVSLTTWEQGGLFNREVALYLALRPHLGQITFVTYGDGRDLAFAHRLEGIRILCNRWQLNRTWYLRTLTPLLYTSWKRPTIFKSNQVRGGELPLHLAKRFGRPCIARCGYLVSDSIEWREGMEAASTRKAMAMEEKLFSQADCGVVTTPHMKSILEKNYGIEQGRIRVIPNYVDTQLFSPKPTFSPHPRRILFIGRLERTKNPFALVEALQGLDVELWIVGDGSERQALETATRDMGIQTRFFGIRPHNELPELINSATAYILPSFWEGHPKTLLEALACGVPCIGSDIPSIRGVIDHGNTGLLSGLDAPSIRQAVVTILDQPELRERLGRNARTYATQHLSLESVVTRELDLYRTLLAGTP